MTKTFIASALALAFVAGTTAMAQEPAAPAPGGAPGAPGGGRGGRAPLEADKDGNILKETWTKAGRPAEAFDMADANKDGKLSPAELQAYRAAMGAGRGGRGGPGGGAPGGGQPPAPAPAQ